MHAQWRPVVLLSTSQYALNAFQWCTAFIHMSSATACAQSLSVGNVCAGGVQRALWYYNSVTSLCNQFTYLGWNITVLKLRYVNT